jgi:hypothetical protein
MPRLLKAQSAEMAAVIQESICKWLLSVNEAQAARLFRKTWCGETRKSHQYICRICWE